MRAPPFLLPLVLLMLAPLCGYAQPRGERPIVRVELAEDAAVPGRSVRLRLVILVPTWMPQPPATPSYDAPNVMVRQDGRAATAVSERIGGKTWAGLAREYLLFPLVAGAHIIPEQRVTIHYADPKTRRPTLYETKTAAFTLFGVAPERAAGLDPFIAADSLSIEQTFDRDPATLEPGDAVVRTVSVRIEGAPPMALPTLLQPNRKPGLAVYLEEPIVEMTLSDGAAAGMRAERATYVAEAGGRFPQPKLRIRWYNLVDERIEVAELGGFEITVRGPPPTSDQPWYWRTWDWRTVLLVGAPGLLCVALLGLMIRSLWPRLRSWALRRREAVLASEAVAYWRASTVLSSRRLGRALTAIGAWWRKAAPEDRKLPRGVSRALAEIGAAQYGADRRVEDDPAAWSAARRALRSARATTLRDRRRSRRATLPPLNPGPR